MITAPRHLTEKEKIIIKALAYGFGQVEICRLFQCSSSYFLKTLNVLFEKFAVENTYYLITKAKREGYLSPHNFVPEFIKSYTYDYAKLHQKEILDHSPHSQKSIWALYHFLLDFYVSMDALEDTDKKKSHRSGIED